MEMLTVEVDDRRAKTGEALSVEARAIVVLRRTG